MQQHLETSVKGKKAGLGWQVSVSLVPLVGAGPHHRKPSCEAVSFTGAAKLLLIGPNKVIFFLVLL